MISVGSAYHFKPLQVLLQVVVALIVVSNQIKYIHCWLLSPSLSTTKSQLSRQTFSNHRRCQQQQRKTTTKQFQFLTKTSQDNVPHKTPVTTIHYSTAALTTTTTTTTTTTKTPFVHSDILWKLCPSNTTTNVPITDIWKWKIQTTILGTIHFSTTPSSIICFPPGDEVILEAYEKSTKIFLGRFGITTQPGPYHPLIQQTIQTLFPEIINDYDNNNDMVVYNVAAIKFMFVEESFRGRNVGQLALEIISYIHSYQKCHFTILVADDKTTTTTTTMTTSTTATTTKENDDDNEQAMHQQQQQQQEQQKLVSWYKRVGNCKVASALQDLVGSPNQQYGIAMIAPTSLLLSSTTGIQLPIGCTIQYGS